MVREPQKRRRHNSSYVSITLLTWAPAVGAGLDSTTQHHVKKGVSDSSVTASAHRAAMGGTDASACMKWD